MQSMYDRLGDILRDRLESDEDPFDTWEPASSKPRQAGNIRSRTPPPRKSSVPERIAVPPELVAEFGVLGLQPGASEDECKKAWKRLLMDHHPDRYAQEPEEQERSTLLATRINDSYRKINEWYRTGKIN